MENNLQWLEWLYKFFTYSSIQVKFISSFLAIIIFIIIRRVIVGIIFKNIDDSFMRYRATTTGHNNYYLFFMQYF